MSLSELTESPYSIRELPEGALHARHASSRGRETYIAQVDFVLRGTCRTSSCGSTAGSSGHYFRVDQAFEESKNDREHRLSRRADDLSPDRRLAGELTFLARTRRRCSRPRHGDRRWCTARLPESLRAYYRVARWLFLRDTGENYPCGSAAHRVGGRARGTAGQEWSGPVGNDACGTN